MQFLLDITTIFGYIYMLRLWIEMNSFYMQMPLQPTLTSASLMHRDHHYPLIIMRMKLNQITAQFILFSIKTTYLRHRWSDLNGRTGFSY